MNERRLQAPLIHTLWGALALSCLLSSEAWAQALKPLQPVPSKSSSGLSVRNPAAALSAVTLDDAAPKALDFIVAVVDNEPITNLEVNRLVSLADPSAARMNRSALLLEALETLIDETAQLNVARQAGIQVPPDELEQALASTAQRNQISVDDMRQRLKEQGVSWEQYRSQIRRQIMLQRVREREVTGRIKIQDFEVEAFLREQSQANGGKPADIHIAHILVAVPEKASGDEVAQLLTKADDLLKKAKAGQDFGKLAAQFSQAPDRNNGGQLGLRSPDRYPSLFADAVKGLAVGEVTGPVRSGAGFHLLKLIERRNAGDLPATVSQTRARHILLRPGGKLSQDAARAQLTSYKKQVETGLAKFEDLARANSQDGSAEQGGDLGWANPGMMVPEFEAAMAKLAPGQVGDPLVSRFGVHLIQVLERREAPLSVRDQQNLARNLLRERKFDEAFKNWEREVRGRAYVEYRETPQ
jgi:peptidyl-prolyl cis-trans isomerase SurA